MSTGERNPLNNVSKLLSFLSIIFGVAGFFPLPFVGGIVSISFSRFAIQRIAKSESGGQIAKIARIGGYIGWASLAASTLLLVWPAKR